MAVLHSPLDSTRSTPTEPLASEQALGMTPAKSGPLWRFALVGLGPLAALGVFALLVAAFQHLA